MPSIAIHIAIAKEYYKKNKLEIDNYDDFILGTIAPDTINKNKKISHYRIWNKHNEYLNFEEFFNDEKVDLLTSYWKGYFLHLIVDYYFYNYDFKEEYANAINSNDTLYNDYYFLNYDIIKDYDLKIKDNIKKFMITKKGNCKYLNYEKIKEFISNISNKKIENYYNLFNMKNNKK